MGNLIEASARSSFRTDGSYTCMEEPATVETIDPFVALLLAWGRTRWIPHHSPPRRPGRIQFQAGMVPTLYRFGDRIVCTDHAGRWVARRKTVVDVLPVGRLIGDGHVDDWYPIVDADEVKPLKHVRVDRDSAVLVRPGRQPVSLRGGDHLERWWHPGEWAWHVTAMRPVSPPRTWNSLMNEQEGDPEC